MAHGKSTVVKAISGVQTVRFKNELERNITIKLGYANAKIYKCPTCERPSCYRAYGSSKVGGCVGVWGKVEIGGIRRGARGCIRFGPLCVWQGVGCDGIQGAGRVFGQGLERTCAVQEQGTGSVVC